MQVVLSLGFVGESSAGRRRVGRDGAGFRWATLATHVGPNDRGNTLRGVSGCWMSEPGHRRLSGVHRVESESARMRHAVRRTDFRSSLRLGPTLDAEQAFPHHREVGDLV